MGKKNESLDEILARLVKNDPNYITDAERRFIEHFRQDHIDGVGYGFMKQLIDWEWQYRMTETNEERRERQRREDSKARKS